MSQRILISGGLGYVGGRLATYLAHAGYRVVLGSRKAISPPTWLPQAEVVQINWDNAIALERSCKGIDVVIQAAGMNAQDCAADPVGALAFNGVATARLVAAACRAEVEKFIYLSTAHVYASPLVGIITEETCPSNLHPYATSHLAGEQAILYAVQQGKISGVVLRLSNATGAPTNPGVNCWMLLINDLCRQAILQRHLKLSSDGSSLRDFVSMDDVCYTIEALCSLPDSELNERIFNLGSEHSYTVFEIAQRVADRCEAIIGYRPKIDTYLNTQRISKYDDLSYRCSRLGAMKLTKSTDINYAIDSLLKFCVAHREVL